jgi:hypothetical protein
MKEVEKQRTFKSEVIEESDFSTAIEVDRVVFGFTTSIALPPHRDTRIAYVLTK